MLFNSLQFCFFFPIVTLGFFALPHRYRWAWLLAASCYFYMVFIPAYILILCFTIVVDYFSAILIEGSQGARRKRFLVASICANVGALATFKYLNFLDANLAALAAWLHWNYPVKALNIILPIGLSFHTFQSMAYTIEVYRGNQRAERHFGIVALYVMFYPQLVAGPIERPQNMLHQFHEKHTFDYDRSVSGLRLMLWGFFKKMVIADRFAHLANPVFNHPTDYPGPLLLLATLAFGYQIYCDFSGYSDIAIGAARVMGFNFRKNFDRPYSAKSVAEFWHRWHISLSTWFRDYLYIPLGGNRVAPRRWYGNLLITFLVSGLWHGANWTFVIWGGLHGMYVVVSIWTRNFRGRLVRWLGLDRVPTFRGALQVASTFSLASFAWIFFRANTLSNALYIGSHLFRGYGNTSLTMLSEQLFATLGSNLQLKILFPHLTGFHILAIAAAEVAALELIQIAQREGTVEHLLSGRPAWLRWGLYYAMVLNILLLGVFEQSAFIYFQF
ncbi:MAG TPA: MBOAT family O-acyltransferase [Verrucomicrobiae bacterium]|nr:MBOAT family O-acyltransferase [Verrucomicrobiae bacterium]